MDTSTNNSSAQSPVSDILISPERDEDSEGETELDDLLDKELRIASALLSGSLTDNASTTQEQGYSLNIELQNVLIHQEIQDPTQQVAALDTLKAEYDCILAEIDGEIINHSHSVEVAPDTSSESSLVKSTPSCDGGQKRGPSDQQTPIHHKKPRAQNDHDDLNAFEKQSEAEPSPGSSSSSVSTPAPGSSPPPVSAQVPAPTASPAPSSTQVMTIQPSDLGSSILGAISSVITNLPLRPQPSQAPVPITLSPAQAQAQTQRQKQYKPRTNRPCPFYKKMPANLVIRRLGVDPKWVRRLPMHEPTLVGGVTVSLIDANHCPGAVLFVFDLHSPKRRYLHTGDFRALPEMCINPVLCQPSKVPIDILYLDTTYSNPRYTFPPQRLVISETVRTILKEIGVSLENDQTPTEPVPVKNVNMMVRWLKREPGNAEKLVSLSAKPAKKSASEVDWKKELDKNRVVICVGTYLIGKERVWVALAKALKTKVFVQPAKRDILSCLEDQEIMSLLTNDPREAQVHLRHMGSDLSPESLQEYLDKLSPTFTRLIALRPTGWTFSGGPKKDAVSTTAVSPQSTPTTLELRPSYTSPRVKIYPVPYSEHSSFNELAGFVRSLDIVRIIPTVGVGSEQGRHAMTEWFRRWEQERQQGIGWL
ncbi:DNA break repair nuclease [Podila epigama]|nr:DNA break repair nuclease [Podila epigama]